MMMILPTMVGGEQARPEVSSALSTIWTNLTFHPALKKGQAIKVIPNFCPRTTLEGLHMVLARTLVMSYNYTTSNMLYSYTD